MFVFIYLDAPHLIDLRKIFKIQLFNTLVREDTIKAGKFQLIDLNISSEDYKIKNKKIKATDTIYKLSIDHDSKNYFLDMITANS